MNNSTFSCNLPSGTTASLARMIDLGLLDTTSIIGKPDRNETSEVQRFIENYSKGYIPVRIIH